MPASRRLGAYSHRVRTSEYLQGTISSCPMNIGQALKMCSGHDFIGFFLDDGCGFAKNQIVRHPAAGSEISTTYGRGA